MFFQMPAGAIMAPDIVPLVRPGVVDSEVLHDLVGSVANTDGKPEWGEGGFWD
jgi:hypothetical protein